MAKKVASDPVNARLEALNTALGTIFRQNHAYPAHYCRMPKNGRDLRLY